MRWMRCATFSILERIDVGETLESVQGVSQRKFPFSILERIDVGETLLWQDWRR